MGRQSMQKKRSHEINSQLLMIMENYCLNSLSRSSHFIMPSSFLKSHGRSKDIARDSPLP